MKDVKEPSIEIITALSLEDPREAGIAVSTIVRGLSTAEVLEMYNAFDAIATLLEEKLHAAAITGEYEHFKTTLH